MTSLTVRKHGISFVKIWTVCSIVYVTESLPKSEFGKRSIHYLSHEISAEGIRATPKVAKGVMDLPFPKSHKGVLSFLGSLNYNHKFIEDFLVVAAVLYELSEDQIRQGRDLSRAHESFELLKRKFVATPMLRHPDIQKPFVIIPHANRWAACAVVGQDYDGKIQPVRYGRVLNDAELRYHIAENEVIAILRALQVFRTILEGRQLIIYTRYSVLKWVLQSKSADGRYVPWGVTLSHWDIEIWKVQKDGDGLVAIMGVGITPREHLDEVVEKLIPLKGHVRKPPVVSVEMLGSDFQGVVLSFDGAAKLSTKKGSCGCVLWQLPGWKVLKAKGFLLENVTVNDAEYHGVIKGLEMAIEMKLQDLVAVGDSRIVIQQVQGLINCNQPHLQTHLANEYNQAADYLTTKTLIRDESWDVTDTAEIAHLEHVSKIVEKLMKVEGSGLKSGVDATSGETLSRDVAAPPTAESAPLTKSARVLAAVTRSRSQVESTSRNRPMDPLEFQAERWRRIRVHQDADEYLSELKDFLKEDFERFSPRRLRKIAKVADLFVLDTRDVLYRLARSTRDRPRDFQDEPRLVVPKALRDDVLHYGHEDFQGGHQGITRTHKKICSEFYWPGMYADVEHFVKEWVDCASGKGNPPNAGSSPGNIEPRQPFEVVSMDFVTHMPKSDRGNTFLLLFQNMFSGYVMCKPMDSTTAHDVAEAYEERVFRNFGASSMIRQDQDPRFMSESPESHFGIPASSERTTGAIRPTVVRSIRAYIEQADRSDWHDHAERLMFALNTSFDATRVDTPFYLIHGWDPQSTLKAMLGPTPSSVPERTAYEWRRKVQRDYSYAKACAEVLQNKARRHRSDLQTQKWKDLSERLKSGFQKGAAVWLYIPKVRTGLNRKLAHLWHGPFRIDPFRIDEVLDDFRVKLKVDSTGYRVNPWVHISRLKPRALFPKRPIISVDVDEEDDFDAALLYIQKDEYEVEKILDLRWSKKTRTSKRRREYLVKWKGYNDPEWLAASQLNCEGLLYAFNQGARARARFRSMQAGNEMITPKIDILKDDCKALYVCRITELAAKIIGDPAP
ncbi:reverse transcriptase [Phytophthora megakarya]|uniref:Reverse transcriptase n=1 Tax=Phytophthora megakarya TaxID=4795 RepID=A0A225V6N4_9STRA|nr:reverse transcriptase [Phytophthora megakarya]